MWRVATSTKLTGPTWAHFPQEMAGRQRSLSHAFGTQRRAHRSEASEGSPAFFEGFRSDIVPVNDPWEKLLELMKEPRGLVLRAAPRTGKTFLGQAAAEASTRPQALEQAELRVEYFPTASSFLKQHPDPVAAATYSAEQGIVFYVDEAQEFETIPGGFVATFFKAPKGRAVFVSPVSNPFGGSVTPDEVVKNTVIYALPAPAAEINRWLDGRLKILDMKDSEAVADLLMELTGGHIGIIQHLGQGIMEEPTCRKLSQVKQHLRGLFQDLVRLGNSARCFGLQNGDPNVPQAEVISMMRCAGSVVAMDVDVPGQPQFRANDPELRRGFNQAFYAPVMIDSGTMGQLGDVDDVAFVHPLQPEIYNAAFHRKPGWKRMSFEERWVTDFGTEGIKYDRSRWWTWCSPGSRASAPGRS